MPNETSIGQFILLPNSIEVESFDLQNNSCDGEPKFISKRAEGRKNREQHSLHVLRPVFPCIENPSKERKEEMGKACLAHDLQLPPIQQDPANEQSEIITERRQPFPHGDVGCRHRSARRNIDRQKVSQREDSQSAAANNPARERKTQTENADLGDLVQRHILPKDANLAEALVRLPSPSKTTVDTFERNAFRPTGKSLTPLRIFTHYSLAKKEYTRMYNDLRHRNEVTLISKSMNKRAKEVKEEEEA